MKLSKGLNRFVGVFIAIAIAISARSQVDAAKVSKILVKWNKAHNAKGYEVFEQLYSQRVIFYCQELSKNQCLLKKSSLLRSSPDFHQELKGEVTVSQYDSGIIKCEFIKEVTNDGKVNLYPSYLLLRNISDHLFICGESDEITDRNLHYTLKVGNVVSSQKINEIPEEYDGYNLQILIISFGIVLLALYLLYRKKYLGNSNRHEINKDKEEKKEVKEEKGIESQQNAPIVEQDFVQKGLEFEKYVVAKFDKNYFNLIHWRSDKGSNGIYAESNGYPDLQYNFQHQFFMKSFAVECKYRQSASFRDTLTIAKDYQIQKYKSFQSKEKMDVYIVLGVGGKPSEPAELYLMPLNKITSSEMHDFELEQFKRNSNSRFFYDRHLDRLT